MRTVHYILDGDGGQITYEVELPDEIRVEDTACLDHDNENEDHECLMVEISEESELFDPVYSCMKCGAGAYLLSFPGEPYMMIEHIEECLGVKIVESKSGDQVRISFQAAQ